MQFDVTIFTKNINSLTVYRMNITLPESDNLILYWKIQLSVAQVLSNT